MIVLLGSTAKKSFKSSITWFDEILLRLLSVSPHIKIAVKTNSFEQLAKRAFKLAMKNVVRHCFELNNPYWK